MNTVLIPPGPGGYGKGLWLPVASGKKVLSLTGREIHPVAIEIGALTESEVVNGFSDIPPDNDILCVVINCAGSLRCGLYPQKGIPTINVLPTWRAGPLAQFISEDNYVSGVTIEQLVLVDTAEAPDGEPEPVSVTAPRIITTRRLHVARKNWFAWSSVPAPPSDTLSPCCLPPAVRRWTCRCATLSRLWPLSHC